MFYRRVFLPATLHKWIKKQKTIRKFVPVLKPERNSCISGRFLICLLMTLHFTFIYNCKYKSKCSDALLLGSKGRYGSFHMWINVWVAGETV